MTPAEKHKLSVLAAKSADTDINTAAPYLRLRAKLADDKRILSAIKGVPDKITAKKSMIARYLPWLDEVYRSGRVQSGDTVFSTALLWLIDTGDIQTAAPYIRFAVHNRLPVADDYQRDIADLLIEETAEQLVGGAALSDDWKQVLADDLTAKSPDTGLHLLNVMDIVRAKFFKALGNQAEAAGQTATALEYYELALGYSDKVGVKKRIEQLKKQAQS